MGELRSAGCRDVLPSRGCDRERNRSRWLCRRGSQVVGPPARDVLEVGHGAAERGEPAGRLKVNENLESLAEESGLFLDAGVLLCGLDEIVIECDGGSHGEDLWHQFYHQMMIFFVPTAVNDCLTANIYICRFRRMRLR